MTDPPKPPDDGPETGGAHHPIKAAEHEIEHLVEVAEEGKSPATPAILAGGLIPLLAVVVLVVIGLSLLIAYLFTR